MNMWSVNCKLTPEYDKVLENIKRTHAVLRLLVLLFSNRPQFFLQLRDGLLLVELPDVVDDLRRLGDPALGQEPPGALHQEGMEEHEDDVDTNGEHGQRVPVTHPLG